MTRWTNAYGAGRSLLAAGTLANLLFHSADELFRPSGVELSGVLKNIWLVRANFFSVFSGDALELGRWLAIAILVLVVSGWRPRVTGLLHAWVSVSYGTTAFLPEGGDQVAANLTLLLLPATLTDPRANHWRPREITGLRARLGATVAASSFLAARLQVAVIYLDAATSKMRVPEWSNGTAMYYWLTKPVFGAPEWLAGLSTRVVDSSVGVSVLTWSVIALELLLFAGLVMARKDRKRLLVAGLLFHFGIVLVHGLAAFFLSMAGALVLYLWPVDDEIRLPTPLHGMRRTYLPSLRDGLGGRRAPAYSLYVDGFCRRCVDAGALLQGFDWLGMLEVKSFRHTDDYVAHGIDTLRLEREMVLVDHARGKSYGGFAAVERLSLVIPLLWAAAPFCALLVGLGLGGTAYRFLARRRIIVAESCVAGGLQCSSHDD